jgi:heme/copper-type cytochrome/quinol oxidase subunit 2
MASSDPLLLLVLVLYALIVLGMGYVFLRVYRSRNRKVKKLR